MLYLRWTAFALGVTGFLFSPISYAEKDIQSLLNEAEGVLLNNKPSEKKGAKASKRKPPVKESINPPPVASDATPKEATIPKLTPIDTTAIQNVIAVDLQASQREREPMYPITVLSLNAGVHSLKSNYSLNKDDDYFYNDNGGQLQGFYVSFSPTWKLGFFENSWERVFISGVFSAGLSQGQIGMRRAGIQPSFSNYGIKIFPIDAGVQLTAELWRRIGIFVGYGPGLEVFHQDGVGINDSITDTFYGDEIWLGFKGKITSTIDLVVSYKWKGTQLLVRSPAFGGQLFSAGVSFGFSG